jgi:hypothetical protein
MVAKRGSAQRLDRRISTLYSKHFSGIAIPVMKMGAVFHAARTAAAAHDIDDADDAAIVAAMKVVIDTIRVN